MSDSGVTSSVTTGMAMALAAGPMRDMCPKNSMVSGTRPAVTAHCVLAAAMRPCSHFRSREVFCVTGCTLPTVVYRMMPTAPNESQNPGFMTAGGSVSNTSPAAASRTREMRICRPLHRAAATMASIHSVRRAGTPKPASAT